MTTTNPVRIVSDLSTGEILIVPLTEEEIAEAQARTAEENARNAVLLAVSNGAALKRRKFEELVKRDPQAALLSIKELIK